MKNIKKTSMFMVAMLIMGFPALSYGATYMYVNNAGQVNTVIADSPAMAIATAPGIAPHSGVALVSNTGVIPVTPTPVTPPVTYNVMTYAYVNTSGIVVTISANSAASAYANAVNIAPHSGVMLLSNTSGNSGVVGDHVSGV
jgi:hypothetical protein